MLVVTLQVSYIMKCQKHKKIFFGAKNVTHTKKQRHAFFNILDLSGIISRKISGSKTSTTTIKEVNVVNQFSYP